MPPKKDAAKSKSPDKQKSSQIVLPSVIVTRLLKTYKANCEATESALSPRLVKFIEKCVEEDEFIVKFIVESVAVENAGDWPVKLEPLIKAIRSARYVNIKDLHIWNYPMSYETIATLTSFVSLPFYPIRTLELRDCLLSIDQMKRFSCVLRDLNFLTNLNLDYNEFGNGGCRHLSEGICGNHILLSLSICYCSLSADSGVYLSTMIANSAVRELYLDGNDLGCEGAISLIKDITSMAKIETAVRDEQRRIKLEEEAAKKKMTKTHGQTTEETEKPKKKAKKGKKSKVPDEPKYGPWLHCLHLADNGIDNVQMDSECAVVTCMQAYATLMATSQCLEELDVGDNLIGSVAALNLVDGLKQRNEGELPSLKLRTTHRIDENIYLDLRQLAGGAKKGKKGKKKKVPTATLR